MQSLTTLLNHPYIIRNRVAEAIYGGSSAAINQRLRARVLGRHRYTKDDYQALRKEGLAFAKKIDAIAQKITKTYTQNPKNTHWLQLIHHSWLNHKSIVLKVAGAYKLSYTRAYDGLRSRTSLPEGFLPQIAEEYRQLAEFVRNQLDIAKSEKKDYPFSKGKGGASHLTSSTKKTDH